MPTEHPEDTQGAKLISQGDEHKSLEEDYAQLRERLTHIQMEKEQAETEGEVRLAAQQDILD